jgi:HD-GYP domain-containing protein (c-di-GMP phosphodiesterase class II)
VVAAAEHPVPPGHVMPTAAAVGCHCWRRENLCHHERIDGSGYPSGLKGDAVPLLAQIVGIVDVYDALTSKRSYRPAWPEADAIQYLGEEVAKGRFHAEHVEIFLETLRDVPVPSMH